MFLAVFPHPHRHTVAQRRTRRRHTTRWSCTFPSLVGRDGIGRIFSLVGEVFLMGQLDRCQRNGQCALALDLAF